MTESITWGQCDDRSAQGWAHQSSVFGRIYWSAAWSGNHNTIERDGQIVFDGSAWRSENNINISYPYAVMDDYGYLYPLPQRHWPATQPQGSAKGGDA